MVRGTYLVMVHGTHLVMVHGTYLVMVRGTTYLLLLHYLRGSIVRSPLVVVGHVRVVGVQKLTEAEVCKVVEGGGSMGGSALGHLRDYEQGSL